MWFEHDVFISYPHLSNRDDNLGNNGWVARFHRDLKLRLSDLLGRDARVWRDNKLPVGAVLDDAICHRLRQSAVLLCVLCPAYLKRDWCLKELNQFHSEASKTGGLIVNQQSRIITAIKTPVTRYPDGLSESLICHFFEPSEDRGGAPREFSQTPGEFKHEEYKKLVNEIAWAINTILEQMEDAQSAQARGVYLAETTSDQDQYRNNIKDELEARKFVVLPRDGEPLPVRTTELYSAAVWENLQQSFMSIHLMGASYGLKPERSEGKSIIGLQVELAAKRRAEDPLFERLIWIPENRTNFDAEQTAYLESLRNNESALLGAELLERPFESLKTRLIQKLVKPVQDRAADNLVRIYLMCDKQDAEAIKPVESFLFDRGFEVIPPADEGDEGELIRYHKDNLLLCDATLILYGNATRNWVRFCLDDLSIRAKGWGREKPIACKAVLRTCPETEHKREFRTRMATVLNPPCYDDKLSRQSLEGSLRDFIDCLESTMTAGS